MDDQISFARRLRREQTPAERRFWRLLEPWRERGWHWRRQAPIGPYVADFVFKQGKLIVEIDGDSHYHHQGMAHDIRRTDYLTGLRYRVVRFTNADVLGSGEGVYDQLRDLLGEPDR